MKLSMRSNGNNEKSLSEMIRKYYFDEIDEFDKGDAKKFILHDGPPYANGPLHIGHGLNKVLKDVIMREKVLNGYQTRYVFGWDCHGLPIELNSYKKLDGVQSNRIRTEARKCAEEMIQLQMKQMRDWGLLCRFEGGEIYPRYKTMKHDYVWHELQCIQTLIDLNFLYEDQLPIYYSPTTQTVLAEAELSYQDHESPSLYFSVPIENLKLIGEKEENVSCLLWTTTPWSIPANGGIAYSKSFNYVICRHVDSDKLLLVSREHSEKLPFPLEIVKRITHDEIDQLNYQNDKFSKEMRTFIDCELVEKDKGSGLIHLAPSHGHADFEKSREYVNWTYPRIVNKYGKFDKEMMEKSKIDSSIITLLDNRLVLETNESIMHLLKDDIIHSSIIRHSYPYDWRSKTPVIINLSRQWFIDMDKIRPETLRCLNKLKWIESNKSIKNFERNLKNLGDMIKERSYWCVSRQRQWGVPIIAIYHRRTGERLKNGKIYEHILKKIDKEGVEVWFEKELKDLELEFIFKKYSLDIDEYEKGKDIMDVWFDSGCSWANVIDRNEKDNQVADVCVEGMDQFRGWFQSSLILSAIFQGVAPFKRFLVHGTILDENERKMSKSEGNYLTYESIVFGDESLKDRNLDPNGYGLDVFRYFVTGEWNKNKIVLSGNILENYREKTFRIRKILRFLLSNLNETKTTNYFELILVNNLTVFDYFILKEMFEMKKKIHEIHWETFDYISPMNMLERYMENHLSNLYFPHLKHQLYFDNDKNRSTALWITNHLLFQLNSLISPVLPHLTEEIQIHHPEWNEKTFLSNYRQNHDRHQRQLEGILNSVNLREIYRLMTTRYLPIRTDIHAQINNSKKEAITVFINPNDTDWIDEIQFRNWLQVAEVHYEKNSDIKKNKWKISIKSTLNRQCERCRLFNVSDECHSSICSECSQ
ncbi:hypothetical protein SNEBB_003425 [Seison nebaliae]|nr:hypothetical protein SNEBB_003425 [Seison nebaliae]